MKLMPGVYFQIIQKTKQVDLITVENVLFLGYVWLCFTKS